MPTRPERRSGRVFRRRNDDLRTAFEKNLRPRLEIALAYTGNDIRNLGGAERVASIAGGAALIVGSLQRPSPLRTLLALGGAALLLRGFAGHCALYHALGI